MHEPDLNNFSWSIHAGADGSVSRRGWEVYSGSGNGDYFDCQTAVANWKRLQNAIMDGDQYRLVSPYEGNHMALNYVSKDTNKAVLFAYDIHFRFQEKLMAVKLQDLDPNKQYKVEEINLMPSVASKLGSNPIKIFL